MDLRKLEAIQEVLEARREDRKAFQEIMEAIKNIGDG
jgi:formiminotetrahydrofolate cyclodeaminase